MGRSRRGRGEGSIYQRRDGLWCAAVSLGYDHTSGKRIRRVVTGKTKAEVQAKLRRIDPTQGGTVAPRVCDWLDAWLALVKPTVEPRTYDGYESHCRIHLKPRLTMPLDQLSSAQIAAMYAALIADSSSPSLVRKIATTLNVALNAAVTQGRLKANPARGVKRPKADRKKIETLTVEQCKRLLAVCETIRLGPLFAAMLDTGFGPGEAYALDWSDFDGAALTCSKSLEVRSGKLRVKNTKNKHRVRRVILTPATVAILTRHRQAMQDEGHDTVGGPIFCDTKGGRLRDSNVWRRQWKPLLKAAGLPDVSIYALRHTMATLLLTAGVHPKVVSERLGHASITLTLDTYSHVVPSLQQGAADAMNKILGNG